MYDTKIEKDLKNDTVVKLIRHYFTFVHPKIVSINKKF